MVLCWKRVLLTVLLLLGACQKVTDGSGGFAVNRLGVLDAMTSSSLEWRSLNVCSDKGQADAHLLRFSDGQVALIDAGENGGASVLSLLQGYGITRIDKVFISHSHRDHYSALFSLIGSSVTIGSVYFNVPDQKTCDAEKPWGCDWDDIGKLQSLLQANGISLHAMAAGDLLIDAGEQRLSVLYAFDNTNSPVGALDINDMSVIMSLSFGTSKALFTGDLNTKLGTYLAENGGSNIEASILKVPHHGTTNAAPNSFFAAVGAQLAVVPAPEVLWKSERSSRIKTWFDAQPNMQTFVNGINGTIRVRLFSDHIDVVTEK